MKHVPIALAATLAAISLASAQTYRDSGGTLVQGVAPLVGCASGGNCSAPVSATNPLPVAGSFSASLSGFQPGSAYATPLSVSTTSSRVALPAGTVAVVYNTGATAAFVQLGGSSVAATSANDVVPAGGWMAFTVGSNAYLAGITASGSTTLNVSGGSGLPTGAGGGSVPTGSAGSPNAAVLSVQGVGGGTALPVLLSSIPALANGANAIGSVSQTGSTGRDYSVNQPTPPNVGANFGASGVYANYYLTATIAAAVRNGIDVENTSGAQIAVVLDDGTAAVGAAPANASVFAVAGGGAAGSQGGSWVSAVERGRVSIYSALNTAIAFTGALTAATSATLTSAWTGPSGSIYVTFSTGAAQLATFANGSTTVSWSTAVTATATATAATAQVAVRVN